ncbi:DedA family protein [Nigerium massiliense]|uniref:DedA family protein n=1 Tax=Nigerium massiliense TaxID=1522317 RepID=UPI0006942A5B|nr:hypothetical protein [Nigerium massiliense]
MSDEPRDISDAPRGPDEPGEPQEWWDDPSLPWRHKPGRADYACLSALGVVAMYGLVMLPLRPVMLGLAPHVLGSLGYRTGLVMVGALTAVGDRWWPVVLLIGTLMSMKFDWIYWWAGKLWGRNIVDVWTSGHSERTRRRYDRAWNLAHRYETIAIVATFLPIPLPAGVIYAALGAAGTTLRKFLIVGFCSALATSAGYIALGYWIGEPAVRLLDDYGRYLWYVSIAILVGMVAVAVWRSRQQKKDGLESEADSIVAEEP